MTFAQVQLPPSDVDADEIRRVTEQVLSRPEYQEAEPGWLDQVWRWVLESIARLVGALGAGRGVIGVAVLAAAVLLAVVVTVVLLRRARRDRGRRPRPGVVGGRSTDEWLRAAHHAEAQQDWAEALRCHYRALLADLIAAGLIEEVAGRTARSYLRDVAEAAPDARGPMTAVTEAFEAAWYDRRPVEPADVDALRRGADAVRGQALVAA